MTAPPIHRTDPLPSLAVGGFRQHLLATLRLGLPVTFTRAGVLVMVMLDTAMTGHFASTDLAWYALAHAASTTLLLGGIGMMVGAAVLTAQALGARSDAECGVIWRIAVLHALGLGGLFALLCWFGEPVFVLLGQPAELGAGAADVMLLLGLGLPGQLVFVASSLFLEALGRPRVGLVLMVLANLLNAGLNWLLIYGQFGVPVMGAEGAALATTLVRIAMAVAIVAYILVLADGSRFNVRGRLTDGWAVGRKFRRLGYPLALAQSLESLSFASLTFIAGLLGAEAVAAFQIVINVIALCYMTAVGIGTAAAVRVGQAVGRGVRSDVALAGWSALTAIVAVMAILSLVLLALPWQIAAGFSEDSAVLAIVVPTLLLGALTLLPDGAQGVLMGALRGTGDVWLPTAMHLCSFVVVMVPAALLFALPLGWGVPGLMAGAFCGTTVATLLLAGRFQRVSRRAIKRL